jgi:hypothetical protein
MSSSREYSVSVRPRGDKAALVEVSDEEKSSDVEDRLRALEKGDAEFQLGMWTRMRADFQTLDKELKEFMEAQTTGLNSEMIAKLQAEVRELRELVMSRLPPTRPPRGPPPGVRGGFFGVLVL